MEATVNMLEVTSAPARLLQPNIVLLLHGLLLSVVMINPYHRAFEVKSAITDTFLQGFPCNIIGISKASPGFQGLLFFALTDLKG